MTNEERRGRKVVLAIIAGTLLISATIIGMYVATLGPKKLPTQIARFILSAGLMWWLYRGSVAAKWIAVVLYGIAGIYGLVCVLSDRALVRGLGVHLGTTYLSVVGALLTSPSANAFLKYQREGGGRNRDD